MPLNLVPPGAETPPLLSPTPQGKRAKRQPQFMERKPHIMDDNGMEMLGRLLIAVGLLGTILALTL